MIYLNIFVMKYDFLMNYAGAEHEGSTNIPNIPQPQTETISIESESK